MNYVRTTVRLRRPLKELLERRALETKTTFQELINRAVEKLVNQPTGKVKLSDFKLRPLGLKFKRIGRNVIYSDAI